MLEEGSVLASKSLVGSLSSLLRLVVDDVVGNWRLVSRLLQWMSWAVLFEIGLFALSIGN